MSQAKPWNIVSNIKCLSVNGHIVHFTPFGFERNIETFDVPKQANEEDVVEILRFLFGAYVWVRYNEDILTFLQWLNDHILITKVQNLIACTGAFSLSGIGRHIPLQFLARTKWTLESLPAACDALYTAVTNGLSDSQIVNYINDQLGDLQ